MSSLFLGLEIGKRGILTSQTALNTVGHNVANADTEGYSRQVSYLSATRPFSTPAFNSSAGAGQIGTGVEVDAIDRIRNTYLDAQYRYENSTAGYWTSMQQTLNKIEVIVNEPSEDGLRSVLDAFWESWQDLSADSENESVRAVVSEQGQAVADVFQHIYKQYSDLRQDLNANVAIDVDQVNTIAEQIKDLNRQIQIIKVSGREPNDLEDQRDLLLDKLSALANTRVYNSENGMINVSIGGRNLVSGTEIYRLKVTVPQSDGMYAVVWEDTGTSVNLTDGEMAALIDARDETMVRRLDKLNELAKTVIVRTNEIHNQGFSLNNSTQNPDGTNFFTMPGEDLDSYEDWAQYISVASAIISDAKNIAAAIDPTYDTAGNISNFGDGKNALAIARLKQDMNNKPIVYTDAVTLAPGDTVNFTVDYDGSSYSFNPSGAYTSLSAWVNAIQTAINGNATLASAGINVGHDGSRLVFSSDDTKLTGISDFHVNAAPGVDYSPLDAISNATTDDFWRSEAAEVGVLSQNAISNSKNQDTLVSEIESQRQSIMGVSLDEEATDMVKFQHAFNASSRFITVIDEMLDTIISKTGVVGR